MNIVDRWNAFTAKCEDQRFKDAMVLWAGTGNDNTRLPVPKKKVLPGNHVYLLKVNNHNYLRFTIIDGDDLNALDTSEFRVSEHGWTARLEF